MTNDVTADVLVAEDDPGVRETLEAALSFEGYAVSTVPDGAAFGRGVDVVVEVRVRVPALTIPGVGSVAEVWWHTAHVEHIDDFRSFP